MLIKGFPRSTLTARTRAQVCVQSCVWKAAPPELLVPRVLALSFELSISTALDHLVRFYISTVPSSERSKSISKTMARQHISVVAALCFLAVVCVHVDAQGSPAYTPMMAPEGAPEMAPEGAPEMSPPAGAPMTPPPMMAPPPMVPPPMVPMSPPASTPSETPVEAPTPAASGPGPSAPPASGASTVVPSVAFALLGAAAFFF